MYGKGEETRCFEGIRTSRVTKYHVVEKSDKQLEEERKKQGYDPYSQHIWPFDPMLQC